MKTPESPRPTVSRIPLSPAAVRRIDDLMARMTLAEKLGQLTMTASSYAVTGPVIAGDSTQSIQNGSIGNLLNIHGAGPVHEVQRLAVERSRLGIPLLIGLDVIHGHRTLFPIPIAEAALFDPQAWETTAREAAHEAAAAGLHMTFAPMLDVSRDPRWGRTAEGPGEDPLLGVLIARAKVRGFQGTDAASEQNVAACAKHFCAYGPVTAGREYAPVDISERTLREVHLPSFVAAVQAGVLTVMPSFTDLNGIPMTMHVALLRDYLRNELGFDGVIVSDYNAIGELIHHGVAADKVEAATLALKAGVDIDMMADAYRHGLPVALEHGLVSMAQIDACVRRVLTLKERLGLFDDPYRRGSKPETPDRIARRRAIAREVGARAIVMLKNDEMLPLAPSTRRLAVIGPLADAAGEMRGSWFAAGIPEEQVSVLAGLRSGFSGVEVLHAPGVPIGTLNFAAQECAVDVAARAKAAGTDELSLQAGIAEAEHACDSSEAVVLCIGEASGMSGEAASRAFPELPGQQRALAEAVIARAHARGKRVVVILFSGRPLVVPWLVEQADAVLAAWFPGCEAGNAIADVLSGRVSPSGRTPISWPRAIGQIPIFYAHRPSGRPENPHDYFTSKYQDVPNEPLFPFGHGLTYGRFEYANVVVSAERAGAPVRAADSVVQSSSAVKSSAAIQSSSVARSGSAAPSASAVRVAESDTVWVRVDLKNDGPRCAEETVFVFTRDPLASVSRPVLELKAFGKIQLRPGESGTLSLSFPAADLRFLGLDLQPVFEPGEVEVLVGPCADRKQLLAATIQLIA